MATNVINFLTRRGGSSAGATFAAAGNELNDTLVAQSLPIGTESTRRGHRWATMSTAAVAGLVVRPSTTAAFEVFNNYAAGGKSLVITRLFWHQLVSVTGVPEAYVGYAQVTTTKTAVTDGSFVVRGNSGEAYAGPVICAASTTVIASGWFPWAVNAGHAAITGTAGGFGAIADVDGRLIVPPQSSLCLHALANTTGQTFTQGAEWLEEQLTIE